MKKKVALTIIGWLISIACIASIFSKMNFHTLWDGFLSAKWSWLAAAAAVNLFCVLVKAVRWQFIMSPACGTRDKGMPSYLTIVKATFIGFAGNNVLPARGGDWLRIYLLGKWFGMSKASLASVTGLDKLFDGVTILFMFALFSLHSFGPGYGIPALPDWVEKGAGAISMVIAASLIICILLLYHYRSSRADNLGRIGKVAKNLGAGMDMLSKKHLIAATIVVSIVSTFLQILTIWMCQRAFDVQFNLWIATIVFIAINLAITIPSAPSGVGPFEAAAVLTYAWLHLKTETAMVIALMYHAVQFFPVTILGFLFYLKTNHQSLITNHGLAASDQFRSP